MSLPNVDDATDKGNRDSRENNSQQSYIHNKKSFFSLAFLIFHFKVTPLILHSWTPRGFSGVHFLGRRSKT